MKVKDPAAFTATELKAASAAELKTAAVRRVAERGRPPVFQTIGETRVQIGGGDGFTDPTSISEFCDDVIARAPLNPAGQVLVVIMEASRQGSRTGVAAVAAATRLTPWEQHFCFAKLASLDPKFPAAAGLMRELVGEWRRLKLTTSAPNIPMIAEQPGYTSTSAGPGDRYSAAVPDEMRLPGFGRVN